MLDNLARKFASKLYCVSEYRQFLKEFEQEIIKNYVANTCNESGNNSCGGCK